MNKERLLNVAKALRESPSPSVFTMMKYGHGCGTPACALGHYAVRGDLQDVFALTESGSLVMAKDHLDYYTLSPTLQHFGITREQEDELFGCHGCGNAQTPNEAADYIERFVAKHA
jgi:hypothetical protein